MDIMHALIYGLLFLAFGLMWVFITDARGFLKEWKGMCNQAVIKAQELKRENFKLKDLLHENNIDFSSIEKGDG